MKIVQNKKSQLGSELILWIFRFVFLGIITIGVVLIVTTLYTQSLDIRGIEALALERKIADCISINGFLNQEILENKNNFLDICGISLNEEFFVKLNITYLNGHSIFNFNYGENLEPLCKTTSNVKYKPECLESKFYLVKNSWDKENLIANILVAIKKFDQNLK